MPLDLPPDISPKRALHILHGDTSGGGHSPRTGRPGKSLFPATWSDQTILDMISDIARDASLLRRSSHQGRLMIQGVRLGVTIRVIIDRHGQVITGFPL